MPRNVDYHSNPDWHYSGDVNAEYGGIWIRHHGDYCDAVEITDLDSACGFDGAVMIERKSCSIPRKLSEAKRRVARGLSCWGQTIGDLAGMPRKRARAVIWQAMLGHGYGDTDDSPTILQLQAGGPMQFDGWTAERVQTGGDIGGYVMAEWLD